MLLEATYLVEYTDWDRADILDGIEPEQQNISVAKLKKTFKLNYLIDLLYVEDNFLMGFDIKKLPKLMQQKSNNLAPQSSLNTNNNLLKNKSNLHV